MTVHANQVFTDAEAIDRLQRIIELLPNDAHVQLEMDNGEQVLGIVSARPMTQVFIDPKGIEGTNAVLRLVDPAMDQPERAGWREVWVGDIRAVRRLDPDRQLGEAAAPAPGGAPSKN